MRKIYLFLVFSFLLLNSCNKEVLDNRRTFYGIWEVTEVYSHAYITNEDNSISTVYFVQHKNVEGEVEFKRHKSVVNFDHKQGYFNYSMDYFISPYATLTESVVLSGEFGWMLPKEKTKNILIEQLNYKSTSLGIATKHYTFFEVEEIEKNKLLLSTIVSIPWGIRKQAKMDIFDLL